jgi:transposase
MSPGSFEGAVHGGNDVYNQIDGQGIRNVTKGTVFLSRPRVCLKINAILLVAQNVERKLICTHLGIKRNTLVSYVKLFLAEGVEGLKQNRYRKPVSPLKDHVESLKRYFDEHPPHSVNEAIDVIERLTKLKYKKSFIHEFLVSLGYSFRKTGGIPAKADVAKQEEFKKNA